MAYDGLFRAQTVLTTLLAGLAANTAAVASEQGVTVQAPGTVYTRPLNTWPMDDVRPVEVVGPTGPLDGPKQSTTGDLSYWVMVSGRDADADHLDTELKCYGTALVRTLDKQSSPDGRWSVYCGRVDYAPPSTITEGEPFLGVFGVEVTVKIAG